MVSSMAIRGILAYDDQGRLVEVDPNAADPNNPDKSEIQPVEFNEVVANNLTSESVNTEQIGTERHYAGAFDGADADARLDNALAAVSNGDTVYLENADYATNRTISAEIKILGTGGLSSNGSRLKSGSTWTLSGRCYISNILFAGTSEEIIINSSNSRLHNIIGIGGGVTIGADEASVTQMHRGTVTFQSGTGGGVVDSSVNITVTDNGTNTIGDIA